jgi:formylglycine-generating enzyme required for sulfatase activity
VRHPRLGTVRLTLLGTFLLCSLATATTAQVINPANGHTYYVSTELRNAPDAETWAQSVGGHLVAINDADENDWLVATFGGDVVYWIGLTDSEDYGGHESWDDPVDGWVWMSGEPVTYTNWDPAGEPNDGEVGDFVQLNHTVAGAYVWSDDVPWTLCLAIAEVGHSAGTLVLIPGGEFDMGDHFGDGSGDELPVHDVSLDPFYMSVYEVTNREYCNALNVVHTQGLIRVHNGVIYLNGGDEPLCQTHSADPHSRIYFDDTVFSVASGKENHPIVEVSWYGAAAYANWRSAADALEAAYDLTTWDCDFNATGYRLPTEAEWEYAARGGEDDPYYRYPWGDVFDGSMANYPGSGDPYEDEPLPNTTPVGYYDGTQIPPGTDMINGYGFYDMGGNAYEWCNDWYDDGYYDSSPSYSPTGPTSGTERVVRGGSWGYPPTSMRVADRYMRTPSGFTNDFGFRLVRPAPPCPGDLNGDLLVNQRDLGLLLADYQLGDGGDVDGDGDTDIDDLGTLLAHYGEACD